MVFILLTSITNLSPERFKRAKNFLEAKRVVLVAGNLTGKRDFYRSGSINQRAAEINQLIYDDTIDIIMSTIGGTNTNSVVPYIDYSYLKRHPETFVSYSDTTALLLAVKAKAPNCRVLYGPALVASFGEWMPYTEQPWSYFKKVCTATGDFIIKFKASKFWSDEKANWETHEYEKK
ncbi:LD-carboxypeptidase [Liquorilactobacillus oeni]|uniref:Microcin C7 immunity protein n=1 Tax=Liquorilactobacillus oeni DSM 19972 TaxID=1423777 RepID=A0A0R1MCV8_9LACO|nr:LD-carboxypeptidase [Liquorilactobacillus oeni]KRL05884.1 microcin C7 immunity protein [Liquorilactobacillus oeni DSM 19972]